MITVLHLPTKGPTPETKPPKHLAICVPVMDKIHPLFSQSLVCVAHQLGRHNIPVVYMHQIGSIITKARNICIDYVEKTEAAGTPIEWILFLDADMVFSEYTALRLISHNLDIVGCTYVRRTPPFDVHGKTLDGKPHDTTGGPELLEMAALPTGCLLIRREVFRKLKRPYFRLPFREESEIGARDEREWGEDYYFSASARAAGYKVWLDVELSKYLGHVSEKVLYPEKDGWQGKSLEELKVG